MNKERLVALLKELAGTKDQTLTDSRRRPSNVEQSIHRALLMEELTAPLRAALEAESPFLPGSGHLVRTEMGATGFHAREAAIAIARRVLRGESVESALHWLEQVLEVQSAPGICILALRGVQVREPVALSGGLTLMPFSALPESDTKTWLSKPPDWDSIPPMLAQQYAGPPTAALTLARVVSPFMVRTPPGDVPATGDSLESYTLLEDVRLALTLAGPSCPMSAGFWFQFTNPDHQEAAFYGGVSTTLEEIIPWQFAQPTDLDPERSRIVVEAVLRIPEGSKGVFRLALRRLNQALRRRANGDRAIDLSIALEILLCDGWGGKTSKVSRRAGLMTGGNQTEREAVRARIKALYQVRSALVHSGALPSTVKIAGAERSSVDLVEEATNDTAAVISSVVMGGAIPEWSTLELGRGGEDGR